MWAPLNEAPSGPSVVPAEVALGGHSLHKAGIHSPGLGASPRLTRPDENHRNCARSPRSWFDGSSPRGTMSPGVAGDSSPLASVVSPPRAHSKSGHPRRSRIGRTLAPPTRHTRPTPLSRTFGAFARAIPPTLTLLFFSFFFAASCLRVTPFPLPPLLLFFLTASRLRPPSPPPSLFSSSPSSSRLRAFA